MNDLVSKSAAKKWGVRSQRSVAEIVSDVKAGHSSATVEATEALKRARKVQSSINAYLTINEEVTMEMARSVDRGIASGKLNSSFAGVPISIKDTEPTRGLRTTFGSREFENYVPEKDGLFAERIRNAGGIFIGKTNTPAGAHKDMTDNLLGPACSHPLDASRTSGGSSGGASVSVALGVEPVAHATDGAGSIRIPAALCGIIGFKPSSGTVPEVKDDPWETRIHTGFVAQRIEDIAAGMEIVSGPDPRDPVSSGHSVDWTDFRHDRFFHERKILYAPLLFEGRIDKDVQERLNAVASILERAGAQVETLKSLFPDPGYWFEVITIFRRRKALGHLKENESLYDSTLRRNIIKSYSFTLDRFVEASDRRSQLYRDLTELTSKYDLLVTSSIPTGAWPIAGAPAGYPGNDITDPAFRWPELYAFNVTGYPAATVPCGFTNDGFPVGVQFVGKWREDLSVLQAAWAYLEGRSSFDHLLRFEEHARAAETV